MTYCEQDTVVTYAKHGPAKNAPEITIQANTKPWGIARVNGGVGSGFKRAWVIDTGIQYNHPDLNVDRGRSRSFISGQSYNDGNGHGTHVVGTIAAKASGSGVIGVALGAPVVALKVWAMTAPAATRA